MTRPPSVPLFSAELAARGLDLTAVLGQAIASGRYVLGPWVQAFESAFAAYVGVGHAIGVANGTDALELALRGLDIGPGQRVLTVANAGFYGSSAILAVGAEPVLLLVADDDVFTLPELEDYGRAGNAVRLCSGDFGDLWWCDPENRQVSSHQCLLFTKKDSQGASARTVLLRFHAKTESQQEIMNIRGVKSRG